MNANYNYKEHAEKLLEVEGLVCHCFMAADGLQPANNQLEQHQYCNLASGVFGLIAKTLEKAHDIISELEYPFRKAHGFTYGENGIAIEDNET